MFEIKKVFKIILRFRQTPYPDYVPQNYSHRVFIAVVLIFRMDKNVFHGLNSNKLGTETREGFSVKGAAFR